MSFYCRRQTDIKQQAPVVQMLDSAIQPVDNAIGFPIKYLLDSNLSSG